MFSFSRIWLFYLLVGLLYVENYFHLSVEYTPETGLVLDLIIFSGKDYSPCRLACQHVLKASRRIGHARQKRGTRVLRMAKRERRKKRTGSARNGSSLKWPATKFIKTAFFVFFFFFEGGDSIQPSLRSIWSKCRARPPGQYTIWKWSNQREWSFSRLRERSRVSLQKTRVWLVGSGKDLPNLLPCFRHISLHTSYIEMNIAVGMSALVHSDCDICEPHPTDHFGTMRRGPGSKSQLRLTVRLELCHMRRWF